MAATVFQASAVISSININSNPSSTLGSVNSNNHVLVLFTGYQNNAPTSLISSVTDNKGNTYQQIIQINRNFGDLWIGAFLATNVVGGTSFTVTMNGQAFNSTLLQWQIFEIAGSLQQNPLDLTASAYVTTNSSTMSVVSGAFNDPNALVLTAFGTGSDYTANVNLAATSSVGTLTNRGSVQDGNNVAFVTYSQMVTSIASCTMTATYNAGTTGALGLIIAFKNAVTGGNAQRFKFYVAAAAQSVPNVKAIVWADVGIAGTEYIEAASLSFQTTLDAGRAVLFVNCPSTLNLTNGTSVKGIAYDTTNTTGLMTGIIEAGAA